MNESYIDRYKFYEKKIVKAPFPFSLFFAKSYAEKIKKLNKEAVINDDYNLHRIACDLASEFCGKMQYLLGTLEGEWRRKDL